MSLSTSPAPRTTPANARVFDPARVVKLAEIVATLRGHPFKKALPPVRFVSATDLPQVHGTSGPLTKVNLQAGYVHERHEILVADDLERSADLDSVLVHELVHALMTDYGVGPIALGGFGGSASDRHRTFARSALIEGDANLVEAGFRGSKVGRLPHGAMAGLTRIHAPWVPMVCRSDADATSCAYTNAIYEEGRAFASALYRVGGTALLDAAHRVPPTTALEILFPDLYVAGTKERPLDGLDTALAAEGVATKAIESLGAFLLGQMFAADAEPELLRTIVHSLRGDKIASLERGGQILLTEWADETSVAALAKILASGTHTPTKLVGPRRLLIGINVTQKLVDSLAPRISPKASATTASPPFERASAAVPPTWEEDLAAALRDGGPKAFRLIGIDAERFLRSGGVGTSHVWLLPNAEKIFFLPTTATTLTREVLIQAIEKAWSGPVAALGEPDLPEDRTMPIGIVHLSVASLSTPSILVVAIARVPICGNFAASLVALQFGADASVKGSLTRSLELLRPAADADRTASICRRLKSESAELVPGSR